jgi:DNA-binding GntR family transcriptional regulator
MALQPVISRKTLHHELVMLLRKMIVEGELGPGSRIPESRLCDHFGVSRTPLREALKVLSAEGLVNLHPNKGARVARVTRKEIEEIVPVLGALAALAGELACAAIRTDELAHIRGIHIRMMDAYKAGDEQSYSDLNHAVHAALFEVARNTSLSETNNMLQTRLRTLYFVTPKTPPHWADAIQDHVEMIAALAAKDGERFARIARRHICHKLDMMQIAFDRLAARIDARDPDEAKYNRADGPVP